jgi:hypothetical protein
MTNAQPGLFDVCARRHGGNANSRAANLRVHPYKIGMRERIRVWVGGCGFAGTTLKEIAAQFGTEVHKISGRISELKRDEQIFDSGRTRGDCAVLVGSRAWVNGASNV